MERVNHLGTWHHANQHQEIIIWTKQWVFMFNLNSNNKCLYLLKLCNLKSNLIKIKALMRIIVSHHKILIKIYKIGRLHQVHFSFKITTLTHPFIIQIFQIHNMKRVIGVQTNHQKRISKLICKTKRSKTNRNHKIARIKNTTI